MADSAIFDVRNLSGLKTNIGAGNQFKGVSNKSEAGKQSGLDTTIYERTPAEARTEAFSRLADRVNNRGRWGGGGMAGTGLSVGSRGGVSSYKIGDSSSSTSARDKMVTEDTKRQDLNRQLEADKRRWQDLEKGKEAELSRQRIAENQERARTSVWQESQMVPLRLQEQAGRNDMQVQLNRNMAEMKVRTEAAVMDFLSQQGLAAGTIIASNTGRHFLSVTERGMYAAVDLGIDMGVKAAQQARARFGDDGVAGQIINFILTSLEATRVQAGSGTRTA